MKLVALAVPWHMELKLVLFVISIADRVVNRQLEQLQQLQASAAEHGPLYGVCSPLKRKLGSRFSQLIARRLLVARLVFIVRRVQAWK